MIGYVEELCKLFQVSECFIVFGRNVPGFEIISEYGWRCTVVKALGKLMVAPVNNFALDAVLVDDKYRGPRRIGGVRNKIGIVVARCNVLLQEPGVGALYGFSAHTKFWQTVFFGHQAQGA